VNGILAVSRALGDYYLHPFLSAEPDLFPPLVLTDDCEFVIFACDGVWDTLSDDLAVAIVRDSLQSGLDVHRAADRLRDLAYLNLSADNVSVVVVQFKPIT
jgi:protein phosphatase 2C